MLPLPLLHQLLRATSNGSGGSVLPMRLRLLYQLLPLHLPYWLPLLLHQARLHQARLHQTVRRRAKLSKQHTGTITKPSKLQIQPSAGSGHHLLLLLRFVLRDLLSVPYLILLVCLLERLPLFQCEQLPLLRR